jgi:hypothetical protein
MPTATRPAACCWRSCRKPTSATPTAGTASPSSPPPCSSTRPATRSPTTC